MTDSIMSTPPPPLHPHPVYTLSPAGGAIAKDAVSSTEARLGKEVYKLAAPSSVMLGLKVAKM